MFKYIFLIGISSVFFNIYAQAEMPSIYYDYIKINEDSKKIKNAKIKKSTSILISKERQDTVNITYYNEGGNIINEFSLTSIITDSETKKIYQKYTFKYDEYSKLVEKTAAAGNDFRKILIEYADNGDLEKEEIYDSKDNLLKEIAHEYDNLGRLIETNEKDKSANCKSAKLYAYDSYNNMAKYKLTSNCKDSAYKAIDITFIYKYDNKSHIIEKNSLYSDKSFKTESFTYGINGKVSQSYMLTGNNQYTVYLYFYDKSELLIKTERTEVNGEDRKKFNKIFSYDKNGNLVEVIEQNEKGEQLFMIKYLYDNY